MIRIKTIIILAGVALGLIYIWVVFNRALDVAMYYSPSVLSIGNLLSAYVEEYGCFPANEDDLVKAGYLRKRDTPDGVEYDEGFAGENWNASPFWGRFTIRYGASIDDISQVDGKLYDKDTGEQVFLLDGPYKKELESEYEYWSFCWYEQMVQAAKDVTKPDPNEEDGKGSESEGVPVERSGG